ncbi:MAG: hypothetical protein GY720_02770, partial [bacterium]|nr:hypothetical protein [bacterium]
STDNGATWTPATWNAANSRYEYPWDTTVEPDGPGTIDARATDSDTNTTNATQINVTIDNIADPALLVTAGDISRCDLTSDNATGALLDTIFAAETGLIATLGDTTYPNGAPAEFVCFDDAWGQHKALINPAVGNHEYLTPGATGYYGYFGTAAGDPTKGYYSYDISPEWHAIALNSNCTQIAGGCAAGGAQEQWLRGDLAANSDKNVVAYWHHPRWSKNAYTDNVLMQPFWQALYEHGAEIVLSGHEHHYERYVPLDASGAADATNGIREFLVGTGGITPRTELQSASPLSDERHFGDHGVLKLYLLPDSYSWEFISVSGTYTDTGTSPVHGAPGVNPTVTITSPAGGSVVSGTTTIAVNATDDDAVGTLNVDVSTDGGTTWTAAPWNGGAFRYQLPWDTTTLPDGPATVEARATDSDTNTAFAATINVNISNNPTGSYPDTVVADGANVYWQLADTAGTTAVDLFGTNNAQYLGSPGLGASGLIVGGDAAVAFDGVDDTIHLVNSAEINQGGPYFTKSIEVWFNLNSTTPRQMLYEQGSIARGLSLYVLNGFLYAGVYNTNDSGGDTPWGPVFLSTPVSSGSAHHAVIVFDQPTDTFSLYLDGSLADSGNGVGELHNHGRSAIGAQWDWARYHDGAKSGNLYYVAGTIDEVALYPIALDATAVANHHALGASTGPVTPSVSITSPAGGATVAGSVAVLVNATDDDPIGTLTVEVSTDSGATWNPTTWLPGISRYEYVWDTTAEVDGPATITARATDSDVTTSTATPVAVTINNAVGPPYRDVVLGDGASVHWRLGEASGTAVIDELGGNNNTYMGSPTLGTTPLISDADTAASFDGINDTIHLVNSVELNQASPALTKTIELWFNADDVAARQVLLEQGSISRGLNIYLMNGQIHTGAYNTSSSGGDTPWGPVFLSSPVVAGATYHVVMVFDQPTNTFSLYVNGALADSDSGGIGQLYPHGRSAIASQWDWARYHDGARFGDQYYFSGTLDEIAVYPSALSSGDISTHYLAGL